MQGALQHCKSKYQQGHPARRQKESEPCSQVKEQERERETARDTEKGALEREREREAASIDRDGYGMEGRRQAQADKRKCSRRDRDKQCLYLSVQASYPTYIPNGCNHSVPGIEPSPHQKALTINDMLPYANLYAAPIHHTQSLAR